MGSNSRTVAQECVGGVEDPAWLRALELGSLCILSMALKAAINLNVMSILSNAGEELTAPQIVSRMSTSACDPTKASSDSLDRILRVLACHGVLTSSSATVGEEAGAIITKYGLTPVSKYFVGGEEDGSLAPLVALNHDKVSMETWHYFDKAVLDGAGGSEPFTKVHGKGTFLYGQENKRFGQLFNSAMANYTKLLVNSLLQTYHGFDGVNKLVEVGGGVGSCISAIISMYPHIKGINFDQPHVIAAAPQNPGVEHVGGDMFESVPKADAILMKLVLHNWSDDDCIRILENCYKALPLKGKLIMVETIIPTTVETGLGARVAYHRDLLMLAYSQRGRERTQEELQGLSTAAGFIDMQVICKFNESTVLESYKA